MARGSCPGLPYLYRHLVRLPVYDKPTTVRGATDLHLQPAPHASTFR